MKTLIVLLVLSALVCCDLTAKEEKDDNNELPIAKQEVPNQALGDEYDDQTIFSEEDQKESEKSSPKAWGGRRRRRRWLGRRRSGKRCHYYCNWYIDPFTGKRYRSCGRRCRKG